MIVKGTRMKVADNSGAKVVECIHIYRGYKRRYAKFGDQILIAVKKMRKRNRKRKTPYRIKKGSISKAVVVQACSFLRSDYNTRYKFFENLVILVNNQERFVGTKAIMPLKKELRYTKYFKFLTVCPGILP